MSAQVTWIHQMQLTRLNRNITTFGYLFIYLVKTQLVFNEFPKLAKCRICNIRLLNLVYFLKSITICYKHKTLSMYYLHPVNELRICFQSESHKNKTKIKQSRNFFVSPVKFTKVHVRGFVNEPTTCYCPGYSTVSETLIVLCIVTSQTISLFIICILMGIARVVMA